MDRRRFLATVALGSLGTIAGCGIGTQTNPHDGTPKPTGASSETLSNAFGGSVSLPVSEDELQRGAPKDSIPAITDPVFGEDWEGVTVTLGVIPPSGPDSTDWDTLTISPRLQPTDTVIGVARGGEARAYPLKILHWHEAVNDTLDGPLLVTYCPLCGSGVSAIREVDGQETIFGVSGLLFRDNLVLYDAKTESLWSQILATAIQGPKTGETLELIPSTLTTWGAWQEAHESPVVLRPPPESDTILRTPGNRDYTRNPYEEYVSSRQTGLGGDYDDDRLHPKSLVLGIEHGDVARAYPLHRIQQAGVVNDEVGGLPVVVTVAPSETLVGYDRRVNGDILQFEDAGTRHLRAEGSRWRTATGTAVDGPYQGTTLRPATDTSPLFFFAWKGFHPETEVFEPSI